MLGSMDFIMIGWSMLIGNLVLQNVGAGARSAGEITKR